MENKKVTIMFTKTSVLSEGCNWLICAILYLKVKFSIISLVIFLNRTIFSVINSSFSGRVQFAFQKRTIVAQNHLVS